MTNEGPKLLASICLVVSGALGIAGTFASSDALRGLAWGVDGVSLVTAGSVITLLFFRGGLDLVASGFLVFTVGQGLILSTAPMSLTAGVPAFGSGVALWTAGLTLISLPRVFPLAVRLLGLIAAILFAIVAIRIFLGDEVLATCVYRKPKPEHNGDEVRREWRLTQGSRYGEPGGSKVHLCPATGAS